MAAALESTEEVLRWDALYQQNSVNLIFIDYLLLKSIKVVVVDMRVAKRVHELAGRQSRHVGDHVREEGVAAVKIYVV